MGKINDPHQVVLISCRGTREQFGKVEQDVEGLFALHWHMPLSNNPKQYAIAVAKTRISLPLIQSGKAFVVNFMGYQHSDKVEKLLSHETEENGFEYTGLTPVEADTVECFRVEEAAAYLECTVEQELDVGDHILFIGHANYGKVNEEAARILAFNNKEFVKVSQP